MKNISIKTVTMCKNYLEVEKQEIVTRKQSQLCKMFAYGQILEKNTENVKAAALLLW